MDRHVRPEETKPILTLAPDEGRFFVGTPPDTVEEEDARNKNPASSFRSPFLGSLVALSPDHH